MKLVPGACPKCGGHSLAEWLDGDTACWICGCIVYAVPPLLPMAPGRQRNPKGSLVRPYLNSRPSQRPVSLPAPRRATLRPTLPRRTAFTSPSSRAVA